MTEERDTFGIWLVRALAIAGVLTWLLLAFQVELRQRAQLQQFAAQIQQVANERQLLMRWIASDPEVLGKAKAAGIIQQGQ